MAAADPFLISLPAPVNTGFTCPNCVTSFTTEHAVIQHLSRPGSCGQWLVRTLPSMEPAESPLGDEDAVDTSDSDNGDDADKNLDGLSDDDCGDDTESGNRANTLYSLGPDVDTAPHPALASRVRTYHPNQGQCLKGGLNHLQRMDQDEFAPIRDSENVYYPFASESEWELANWLASGVLSQKDIDAYLHLQRTKDLAVSFNTAKDLRARIESLPEVPRWRFQEIKVGSYQTKDPLILYWRDGLEVVEHLFRNPVFAHCMDLDPYQEFEETPNGMERVYGEFMSADQAWKMQDSLPSGHSFVGVIGASDKTPLTIGTGNKEMHPLLLSLANIHAGVRMKATSHSFALAAYLPIPKFRNVSPAVQAVLSARVYHFAVSIVMKELKGASRDGTVLSDPNGDLRIIHTPLVAWIADYPEQLLVACVSSKNSPISIATAAHFGDPIPHPPRLRQNTLAAIREACIACDPCDIVSFHKVCLAMRLNGVVEPFWGDWGDACPSLFLTPDALHQWHKFYFDHCLQWVINIIGGKELDRRLALLQPRTGTRSWPNGISTLKQCTGREHRDLEKVLPAVAAGALPDDVLCAIRALTEFIFLAQNVYHCDETLHALAEALREFHHYKQGIISAGGRQGKNGPLQHFQIPKLELAQHVVRSTRAMGAAYQWSSDITERCHITHVKTPYRLSNRRDFHTQCCRFLDRQEKQRFFQLFTTLKTAGAPLINEMVYEATQMQMHYPESTWVANVLPNEQRVGSIASRKSIFDNSRSRISSDNSTAFLVTVKPHFPSISVDDTAFLSINDLRPALGDFFSGRSYTSRNGRRLSLPNCPLPFSDFHAWNKFRIQQRSVQDPLSLSPPQTIQAVPPSTNMPWGRANTVLISHESGDAISADRADERYLVAQVRVILLPITVPPSPLLLYVDFFNFSNAHFAVVDGVRVAAPAPKIEMFVVQRRVRNNGQALGDIIHLDDVHQVVQLVPKFGAQAPPEMTCDNSLEVGREFYVNGFADKEIFHAILSYQ
ncbi:hypothetical protein PISMIDRAFT_110851 [Pisolithus microcarpus 441]|uniref:DUF6830 domain-containing protein n=1 Tax=Pisolithus microcarpus 441 TaxID=765257 RepID=A0A0C9ZCL3_9AGAM|nr:hypothetical protein BKA83DRAFT_110851 [Pisolithus microcarpus]KIK17703.1 hypothetical protein PISMIDRAFT_110851 [Pisolithus microcarpus 441]